MWAELQLKGPHRSVGALNPNSMCVQRGEDNCEPIILNGTGRVTNWWEVVRKNKKHGTGYLTPAILGGIFALRAHCPHTARYF